MKNSNNRVFCYCQKNINYPRRGGGIYGIIVVLMSRLCLVAALVVPFLASASWYWPFGSSGDDKPRRVSELMEPASQLIDNASDYAEDGKVDEAVEEYRKALAELDRIEIENPDRVDSPEFATLRNKRAYVNSAIDSLLLDQARRNAKSVAITDTTELEKIYERHLAARRQARSGRPVVEINDGTLIADGVVQTVETANNSVNLFSSSPAAQARNANRRERMKTAVEKANAGDDTAAMAVISGLLAEWPNDAGALNLKARIEMKKGELETAESTLDQCIRSNPRSYYAFYNMARVLLLSRKGEDGRKSARKFYKRGRDVGGPKDEELEKIMKNAE